MHSALLLHLGCGQHVVEGWVNIDGSLSARLTNYPRVRSALKRLRLAPSHVERGWPHGIQWHDLRSPLPFPAESVQAIYSSHTLEHLYLDEADRLLRECHRVLAPGGVIRIVVPDLHAVVTAYMAARSAEKERAFADPDLQGSGSGATAVASVGTATAPRAADELNAALNFRLPVASQGSLAYRLYSAMTDFQTHKWMYDEDSLCNRLEAAGFSDVAPRALFDSRIPDIERIEQAERVVNGGLVVEGLKAATRPRPSR